MTDEPNAVENARNAVVDKAMRGLGISQALDVLVAAVRADERRLRIALSRALDDREAEVLRLAHELDVLRGTEETK